MQGAICCNDALQISNLHHVVAEGVTERIGHPSAGFVKNRFRSACVPQTRASSLDVDVCATLADKPDLHSDAARLYSPLNAKLLANRLRGPRKMRPAQCHRRLSEIGRCRHLKP